MYKYYEATHYYYYLLLLLLLPLWTVRKHMKKGRKKSIRRKSSYFHSNTTCCKQFEHVFCPSNFFFSMLILSLSCCCIALSFTVLLWFKFIRPLVDSIYVCILMLFYCSNSKSAIRCSQQPAAAADRIYSLLPFHFTSRVTEKRELPVLQ